MRAAWDQSKDEKMARVALVTGGTRGIGAAISEALLKGGYCVAATYAGNDVAAKAFRTKTGAAVYRWDASDFEACVAGIREVEAAVGPIDVLVNNAGIVQDSALHKMTKAQWDEVIATDLNALFNMCRPVIEGMRTRKFGRINISSINGQKGQFGQTNYSAAKAGDLGFTRALALESARSGITVNAICPGYIHTEMLDAVPPEVMAKSILPLIPVGRLGEPEDIARAVLFLAADEASFITGSTLSINGGQYMS
jgi:acetoacetyl-CoA reductase